MPASGSTADRLRAVIDSAIANHEAVAVQVLFGREGNTAFFETRGTRVPNGLPVDRETMFCIGSCSKPIAATALLRLVYQGVLQLHRPVDK